jgi:NADPH-dependent glutamate synthase beta subunit-like oxidoreductase/ferredoxin
VDPDATRRLRLLAVVTSTVVSPFARLDGPRLQVVTGDDSWFDDNIPCMRACPVNTDVASYIAHLADADAGSALTINTGQNLFAGTLGRTCSRPCEDACRRAIVDEPIRIRALKRAASDAAQTVEAAPYPPLQRDPQQVAIIGAGVAGLTVAHDLRRAGISVTLLDRDRAPGGLMHSGVPAWRLPRDVVATDLQRTLPADVVTFMPETPVDTPDELDRLARQYDAVVIATGAQVPRPLPPFEGPDEAALSSPPIIDGLSWLADVARNADVSSGPTVVIGGSYTAVDCARTARRLSGAPVTIVTRSADVPSSGRADLVEEFREAEAEGVTVLRPATLSGFTPDGGTAIILVGGQPDQVRLPVATVIVAIGQWPDLSPFGGPTGAAADWIYPAGQVRDRPGVWVAGDVATGPTTFIDAIADARRVAGNILATLDVRGHADPAVRAPVPEASWTAETLQRRLEGDPYLTTAPQSAAAVALDQRGLGSGEPTIEIDAGLIGDAPLLEATRCLQCQANIMIDGDRCIVCNGCVDACPYDCIEIVALDRLASVDGIAADTGGETMRRTAALVIDEDSCVRCGLCVDWCPTACITMPTHRTGIAGNVDADLRALLTARDDAVEQHATRTGALA